MILFIINLFHIRLLALLLKNHKFHYILDDYFYTLIIIDI